MGATGRALLDPTEEEVSQRHASASSTKDSDEASVPSSSSPSASSSNKKYNCFQLVALGVGAVISGNFFGWQNCLVGGLGGTLVGLVPVTAMYAVLSASIAELCSALPHADGPFGFLHATVGPRSALIAGFAETIKIVATCAVVVDGLAAYLLEGVLSAALSESTRSSAWINPVVWAGVVGVFVLANSFGAATSVTLQVVMFVATMALLLAFYAVGFASPVGQPLNYSRWALDVFTEPPPPPPPPRGDLHSPLPSPVGVGQSADLVYVGDSVGVGGGGGGDSNNNNVSSLLVQQYFPAGVWTGSLLSLPFCLWFYLGIEELPLVGSLAREPARDVPRALGATMVILTAVAALTLFISCSLPPGIPALLASDSPMVTSLEGIFCPPNASIPLVWTNGNTSASGGGGGGGGGIANMSECATPLQEAVVQWAAPFLVLGLACSLYSFVFCCGQILHTISTEGYYPRCFQGLRLSSAASSYCRRHRREGRVSVDSGARVAVPTESSSQGSGSSPVTALVIGGVLMYATLMTLYLAMGPDNVATMSAPLVSLALLGGCTSYILQLVAFLSMRQKSRQSKRNRKLEAAAIAGFTTEKSSAPRAVVSVSCSGSDGDDELDELASSRAQHDDDNDNNNKPTGSYGPPRKFFRSPFGVAGAVVGIVVAVAVVAAILATGFLQLGSDGSGSADAAARGTLVLNCVYFALLGVVFVYNHALVHAGTPAQGPENAFAPSSSVVALNARDHAGGVRGVATVAGPAAARQRSCPRVWTLLTCGGQCHCGVTNDD